MALLLVAAMLLVAALVFNMAHLNTGGEALPPAPGTGAPQPNFWGLILSNVVTSIIAAACLLLLVVAVGYALMTRKRPELRGVVRPMRWTDVVAMIIALVVLLAFLLVWPRVARTVANANGPQTATANNTFNTTTVPALGGIPLGVLLVAGLVLLLVGVAVLLSMGARLRGMVPARALTARRRAVAATLEATISELQLGGDVRQAILACYQRFCFLLGRRGIDEQEPLTPRELESIARDQLAVSSASAESLTSLFEEARYSTHPLGEADRDRAVESLARIRETLGG